MKDTYIQRVPTWFLRGVIFIIGIIVLLLCIFSLPKLGHEIAIEYPEIASLRYPVLVGMYAAAIPFFIMLSKALMLLSYIDKNKAFSESSTKALRQIKYGGFTMSLLLYASLMPLFFRVAQIEDAPGIVIIGAIVTSIPIVVAVFSAILERLLRSAIDLQAENNLTV